jgi:hypothetical protein
MRETMRSGAPAWIGEASGNSGARNEQAGTAVLAQSRFQSSKVFGRGWIAARTERRRVFWCAKREALVSS